MRIVQKYGGSSLADESCVRRVAKRICSDAEGNNLLVVVSAQGKTTDCLTSNYQSYSDSFPSRESDALLCTGELISAALLAATLNYMGKKAISLTGAQVPIIAEGNFGEGQIVNIPTERIEKEWASGNIVVVTGFQGITSQGDFITLGRGGSDTSAVAFAAAVKADKCMIFTDVDGIYSADPNRIADAVRFDEINVETVLVLADNGAKVLHPNAARLIREKRVPTEILTSFSVRKGTVVSSDAPRESGITSRLTEENSACITVVFDKAPKVNLLTSLSRAYYPYDSVLRGCLLQISVPRSECDNMMARLHGILYPKI